MKLLSVLVRVAMAMVMVMVIPPMVQAQVYPSKPIRLVVPYPPGSASDGVARILMDDLRKALNTSVIIDNRPGASGLIGTELVARSAPDGYTLVVDASATHSVNPWLFKKLPYDPVQGFTHITRLVVLPQIVVASPKLPVTSLQELVRYARANPNAVKFAYGTPTSQVAASALAQITKMNVLDVPYKGPAEAMTALMGDEANVMVADLSTALPHARAGRLRPMAISTQKRSSLIPDVPSLTELGYQGFDVVLWIGVSGPAGLPKPVVDQLSSAFTGILSRAELKQRYAALGMELVPTSPDEFERFVKEQLAVWGQRIKAIGLEPQ